MPTVIGQSSDGREVLSHAPEEGCAWQCTTCGDHLRERFEVRGHWALHSTGHSVFRHMRTGKVCHQTIEGLHARDWEVAASPPEAEEDDTATAETT